MAAERRPINLKESPDARLQQVADLAEMAGEDVRYRLLGMLFHPTRRQWISDRRDGIYIDLGSGDEAKRFQEFLDFAIDVVANYGIGPARRALETVGPPAEREPLAKESR